MSDETSNEGERLSLQELMDELRRTNPEVFARTAEEDRLLRERGMTRHAQFGTDDPNGKVWGVFGMGYFQIPEGGGYQSWTKMDDEPGFYGWRVLPSSPPTVPEVGSTVDVDGEPFTVTEASRDEQSGQIRISLIGEDPNDT